MNLKKVGYMLFILMPFSLCAFEFEISEMVEVTKSPEITIKDQNNDICAKVVVSTEINDVNFGSGSLGIVGIENNKPSKTYILYLPWGSKSLWFKHKEYVPYYYTFKGVEKGKTYKVSLGTKKDSKDPNKFKISKNKIVFNSLEMDPSDMTVRYMKNEDCKAAIRLISDLPVKTLKTLFNQDITHVSCETPPCSEPVENIDKMICIKKLVSFNELLNNIRSLDKSAIGDITIEKNLVYNLLISWR